jgi:L-cysteate sulfo-lyase
LTIDVDRFPRERLAHLPTPIEPLPRLSRHLGGPHLWVKRDDCTGLATGGNKTRKLEFVMAAALADGADTIVTVGAIQTNHGRQTAAAAARLGLRCEIVMANAVGRETPAYLESGNVLLDRLLGARLTVLPPGSDLGAAMAEIAERVRDEGGRPHVVPVGASTALGSLGYVGCALELGEQLAARGLEIDHLVTASGSAGTQAGLLVGLEGTGAEIPVMGICVSRSGAEQEEKVFQLAMETAELAGVPGCLTRRRVVCLGDYVGEGYGIPTDGMREAVSLAASLEGLLLDPVYSGKAMAGLVDQIRRERFGPDENVLFLHTGGVPGLFAYVDALV